MKTDTAQLFVCIYVILVICTLYLYHINQTSLSPLTTNINN